MAAFLTRAFDLPVSTEDPYLDDDGSAFEADIAAIHAAGITAGCAGGIEGQRIGTVGLTGVDGSTGQQVEAWFRSG